MQIYGVQARSSHTHTHIHANTRRHTHACKDIRSTRACARAHPHTHTHTHTKRSFVIGGPILWNHLPHTVKEAGSNSLSRYLKRSYVVNLSEYRLFLNVVTVPLTLFDSLVVKYGAKCPTSSYNTPVSTCAMYETL